MGRNFKLRFSEVIRTFKFCRCKDPSNLPTHPVPSSRNPSIERHVSPAIPSNGRNLSPIYSHHAVSPPETPRHKIYNSSASEYDLFPSAESWFCSGDEREERESDDLIIGSSRSFSTDQSFETIKEIRVSRSGGYKKKKKKRPERKEKRKVSVMWRPSVSSEEGETPARLSVFLKLIPCVVEGKVKESFAVVKKSEDPYEDFKRSMVEMILEKQMFEDTDLEQLLHCFLSLNSRYYHGLIVEAFTEIWEAMFCIY